jgi:drug/metabolite transporter (DMT)-like permease
MVRHRLRLTVVLGLGMAILLDTCLQLSWKVLASRLPAPSDAWANDAWASAEAVLHQPLLYAVVILMLCQLINWLKVLDHADLSFAKPITSLSKVSVCILSAVYLNERVDALKVVGIMVVLAGVWCVCQTDHASRPKDMAS